MDTVINSDLDQSVHNDIAIDQMRRQMDRRLLERIDADHERLREMSGRTGRFEAVLSSINNDLKRLDESLREIRNHTEQTAVSMSVMSSKLASHTEMEEIQWTVINKSQEKIVVVAELVNDNVLKTNALELKMTWMERIAIGLLGTLAAGVGAIVYEIFMKKFLF